MKNQLKYYFNSNLTLVAAMSKGNSELLVDRSIRRSPENISLLVEQSISAAVDEGFAVVNYPPTIQNYC